MAHGIYTRRRWMGTAVLVLAFVAWLAPADAEEKFKSKITWLSDLAAARTLAEQEGKPLYVAFRCIP